MNCLLKYFIFLVLTMIAIKTSAQKQIEHDVFFKFNSSRIESSHLKSLDSLLQIMNIKHFQNIRGVFESSYLNRIKYIR